MHCVSAFIVVGVCSRRISRTLRAQTIQNVIFKNVRLQEIKFSQSFKIKHAYIFSIVLVSSD